LGGHTDALAARFHKRGYSPHTARILLRGVAHLSHYLLQCGIIRVAEMRPEHVASFFRDHLPNCTCAQPNLGAFESMPVAVHHLMEYLREEGVMQGFETAPPPPDPVADILMCYDVHLDKVRGLSQQSRNLYRSATKRFLDSRYNRLGALKLAEITPAEVLDYVRESLAAPYSAARKKSLLGCLRAFLRFLCWERIQSRDLSGAVPTMMHWKLADVPKHMPFDKVRLLLNTPNPRTPIGKRDRAILRLLALLGLRAGEVVALELEHIHWREGLLTVPKAKTNFQRSLPLSPEVAKALSDYLQHGRPKTQGRTLFLRQCAPVGPLSNCAVGAIVRGHILRAGIKETTKKGSHVLRHSLATCLINEGVPLKQISDILGHANIQTTLIYTKVDVRHLNEVARPFPAMKDN
jgi:site-specific recombinase XerD